MFALFAVEPDGAAIRDFLGTGFLLAGGIVVTCWHCIREAVERKLAVAAVQTGEDFSPTLVLRDLAQDGNGSDIATARLDRVELFGLKLAAAPADTGTDVWTYGFPLTDPPNERRRTYLLNARYLEGYITRAFYYSDARVPSYELDMRAPAGLSGAPLIEVGCKRVIGVVYGVHEAERIERFATRRRPRPSASSESRRCSRLRGVLAKRRRRRATDLRTAAAPRQTNVIAMLL